MPNKAAVLLSTMHKDKAIDIIMLPKMMWIAITNLAEVIMLEEEQEDGSWVCFFIFQTYFESTHLSYTERILITVLPIQDTFFGKN